jgi:hypothetical protein
MSNTTLDINHVIEVVGEQRFIDALQLPDDEFHSVFLRSLTPNETARLNAGPHGRIAVYLVDTEIPWDDAIFTISEFIIDCECGERFTSRLLSLAQEKHDNHSGRVAVSHVHTAQLLEG